MAIEQRVEVAICDEHCIETDDRERDQREEEEEEVVVIERVIG
jgi:hypothetical protein